MKKCPLVATELFSARYLVPWFRKSGFRGRPFDSKFGVFGSVGVKIQRFLYRDKIYTKVKVLMKGAENTSVTTSGHFSVPKNVIMLVFANIEQNELPNLKFLKLFLNIYFTKNSWRNIFGLAACFHYTIQFKKKRKRESKLKMSATGRSDGVRVKLRYRRSL